MTTTNTVYLAAGQGDTVDQPGIDDDDLKFLFFEFLDTLLSNYHWVGLGVAKALEY